MIPIFPFAAGLDNTATISTVTTAAVFFAIGTFRSLWSPRHWWLTGLKTFAVGTAAALVAHGTGYILQGLI